MPISPERKNVLVLARDFRDRVFARTGINDFDADSKADALISVFADQVISSRNESIGAFYANQISNAKGTQLDTIGEDLGLPRYKETFASIDKRDLSLAFFPSTPTFGGLNGGAGFTIPAGTSVFSDSNENELGAQVRYKLTSDLVLSASGALSYASAKSEASGVLGNVGSGALRNHSFTSYSLGTGLSVVNLFSVLNGRTREVDRNYRFRLARRYDTLSSSNNSKLHLLSLRTPGVLDTRIVSGYFGIGTAAVVVIGAENQSSSALVNAVQARLRTVVGPSSRIDAIAATAVSVDIEMQVSPLRALTVAEKRQFELTVRRSLKNYFRNNHRSICNR